MNGYKNYETWNCYNWLTADEASAGRWERAAREALTEANGDREKAALILADEIQAAVEDSTPPLAPGLYKDLLEAALQEIDFAEVAASFIE